MMSVGPAGCSGLHGLCPHPRGRRLAVLRGVACGCGAGIGQGSSLSGAGLVSRPSSPGHEGCLSPIGVRTVGGGFRVYRKGNPHRVAAAVGVSGSLCVRFALGAPEPLGTVVAGVPGRLPWSPRTKIAQMLCSSWLHGLGARWCHNQCSPFISSRLYVPICGMSRVAT